MPIPDARFWLPIPPWKGADPGPAEQAAFDPSTGYPWTDPQDEAPVALVFDETAQAWAISPPAAAVFDPATGFPWNVNDSANLGPTQFLTYDDTDQAWTPDAVAALAPFVSNEPGQDVTGANAVDDTAQSYAIQPPAVVAFDPATGFPWAPDFSQDAPLDQTTDQPDASTAVGAPSTELAGIWNGPQPDLPAPLYFDDTSQSWAIATAPNWDPATGWPWQGATPDVSFKDDVDVTSQTYAIQPVAAAAFDPATGFPWIADTQQDQALDQTTDQPDAASAIGQPSAELAGIWNGPQPDVPFVADVDVTSQSWSITTAPNLDPTSGFPWSQLDPSQDRSLQPVWYDGQDSALGLTPPAAPAFDPATGFPWNGDAAQDASTQPTWYDGLDGSFIGQPYNPALFPFQGWDPQQDRSLQPVWYDPSEQAWAIQAPFDPSSALSFISADHPIPAFVPFIHLEEPQFPPFAALSAVVVVTGGYGPNAGSAYNSLPGGSASAPLPSGSAAGPLPSGSATNPRPER